MKRAQFSSFALSLLLGGCMVGPDYHQPATPLSAKFKEAPPPAPGWTLAQPADTAPRGPWWELYGDPTLNQLEPQVQVGNQNLRAAEAAFRQAVAVVAEVRASLFPTIGLAPTINYGNRGAGASTISSAGLGTGSSAIGTTSGTNTGTNTVTGTTTGIGTGTGGSTTSSRRVSTTSTVEGTVDWEIDVWGRIRREIESNVAAAQASAADIANARLSAQAQLAIDYFELRAADSLTTLLRQTVQDYTRSLQITQNQYGAGTAARADVITAQTQLAGAQSQLIQAGVQRAALEHAIAVLIGKPPADLNIPPAELTTNLPVVPAGVPSALLQRRPDIAAAERTMQQENALIGAAIAAYYPQISISALYGFSGDPFQGLFSAANRLWSLGAAGSETLFEGGARTAAVAAARAGYDSSVATYRQTVLTAFEQVEDQLSSLRILADQARVQADAVALAQHAVQLTINQYKAGTVPYTSVITQQATLLADQQTALTIQQNRFVASVTLVEAVGGGFETSQLPDKDSLQSFNPLLP